MACPAQGAVQSGEFGIQNLDLCSIKATFLFHAKVHEHLSLSGGRMVSTGVMSLHQEENKEREIEKKKIKQISPVAGWLWVPLQFEFLCPVATQFVFKCGPVHPSLPDSHPGTAGRRLLRLLAS